MKRARTKCPELEERIQVDEADKRRRGRRRSGRLRSSGRLSPMSAEAHGSCAIISTGCWSIPLARKSGGRRLRRTCRPAQNDFSTRIIFGLDKVKETYRRVPLRRTAARQQADRARFCVSWAPPGASARPPSARSIARATGREFVRMSLGRSVRGRSGDFAAIRRNLHRLDGPGQGYPVDAPKRQDVESASSCSTRSIRWAWISFAGIQSSGSARSARSRTELDVQ